MIEIPKCKLVKGGNVPGGHHVICNGSKAPFITPVKETNSIPLHHSDIVVDIGAYVGTYAIRCARFPVKKVIAYEPTPATFEILKKVNLPNYEIINAAVVGYEKDYINLHISKGIGVTNSTVLSNRKEQSIAVPAIRYEEAIKDATIVKIDVEGEEYSFNIVQPQLRAIIIDFHPIPKRPWIAKAKQIIAEIKKAGFETVVEPKWENGWTRAGSWIRPMQLHGECEPLMQGKQCCGCGVQINTKTKGLCASCFKLWSKEHRKGFETAT